MNRFHIRCFNLDYLIKKPTVFFLYGKNECLETINSSFLHPLFQVGISRQKTIGFLS